MKSRSPILAAARLALISGALLSPFAASSFAGQEAGDAQTSAAQAQSSPDRPALNLKELEHRVRATRAIGVLQKLELQNEVDGLLARFRDAHSSTHAGTHTDVSRLRRPYEQLLASIQSRLERDPQLAGEISASREAIWGVLTDRTKFAGI